MSLVGGLPIPLSRFPEVLRHALAAGVHEAQVVLSLGVSLVGGLPVPLSRFPEVVRHFLAVDVHATQEC